MAAVREVAERGAPDLALANHLVMGPADPRAGAAATCPTRSRSTARAGVHGQAAPGALPARTRARACGRARGVLVGSATRRRACGRRWTTPTLAARTRLGPPGVDIERFAPARAGSGPRRACRTCVARLRRAPRRESRTPRFARDPAAAAAALADDRPGGPPGRVRGQADRLQGRRPAAGRLAAGARADAGRAAGDRRLRRVPRGPGGARRALGAATSTSAPRPARRGRPASCRTSRAFLERAPEPRYPARRRAAERVVRGAARPRRARRPAARRRGDGRPQHVPRGVRDGRRRGRGVRRAAGGGAATPGLAEVARTLSEAVPEAARPLLAFERGADAVPQLAAARRRLARGARGAARRHARGDGGGHARALLVGRRGADRAGRGGGPPRRLARPPEPVRFRAA